MRGVRASAVARFPRRQLVAGSEERVFRRAPQGEVARFPRQCRAADFEGQVFRLGPQEEAARFPRQCPAAVVVVVAAGLAEDRWGEDVEGRDVSQRVFPKRTWLSQVQKTVFRG